MDIDRPQLLDPYDLRARLFPALLVLLPVPVSLICLSDTHKLATTILSVLAACGLTFALSRIARNAGKRLERPLFDKWGGAPTTQLLRHSDGTIDEITKERYHLTLSRGIAKTLPSIAEESSDPSASDKVYGAAVTWLLGQTRDLKKFPLVLKENVSYGFHRNCLGMRSTGMMVATVAAVIVVLVSGIDHSGVAVSWRFDVSRITMGLLFALSIDLIMLFVWLVLLREASVKSAAFAYGIRLLECCDQIAVNSTTSRKSATKGKRKE